LHSELLLQEHLDKNPTLRSFSWQVLRKASEFFGAKTYTGETGLTTPPFFLNARRGVKFKWGVLDDSPVIMNWSGLDPLEQAEINPALVSTDNWIIFTHPLAQRRPSLPRCRLVPRESSLPKGQPVGRECVGGWERTNLPHSMAWTLKYGSVKTARSPTPASSPWKNCSDQI